MKVLKSLFLALTCLSLASVGFTDAAPNYIMAYNGTGNNHNTVIYSVDYSGNQVMAGAMQFGTFESNASQALAINGAASMVPADSFMVLQSSGANVVMTAKPTISTATVAGGSTPWPDGTRLILTTTGTVTVTLQDNGTLSGSSLHLGANTRVVGADKILTLIYVAAQNFWDELAYANNN